MMLQIEISFWKKIKFPLSLQSRIASFSNSKLSISIFSESLEILRSLGADLLKSYVFVIQVFFVEDEKIPFL